MNSTIVQSEQMSGSYGSISFLNADGIEVQAAPRHLGRHEVSFELFLTDGVPQSSEVLKEFRVSMGGRTAYSGRATIISLIPAGPRVGCRVSLEDPWAELGPADFDSAGLSGAFDGFLDRWRKYYQVRPEFKVVVADMQTLLTDLELWLTQFELGGVDGPEDDVHQPRDRRIRELARSTTPTLNALFEKFESTAATAAPESRSACRILARRQLHSLLLCAPFLHRTYRKPLGYAGDYEMVNMISRDPFEGSTLFAKLVNVWFLAQPPAEAHRNRLKHLQRRIAETAVKAAGEGRPARILTLGCGPAVEIQEFIRNQPWADRAEFTLIDFNQETLDRTGATLRQIKQQQRRSTAIELTRQSVMSILREDNGSADRARRVPYDFVYCAGLFDYLTDPVCRRLSTQLYQWVRPGGLFLTTNVHVSNPWPLVMDYIMDWHLIYRSTAQMLATRPEQLDPAECSLATDPTGVNIFLEARKPELEPRGLRKQSKNERELLGA